MEEKMFDPKKQSNKWNMFAPRKKIICPNVNCKYRGIAKATKRGSILVGLFLLCILILPGLLYFAFMDGYNYSCPKCGQPMGQS
ncbi:MAG: hypothetical protein L6246_10280 [Thermodesulfovibrionales bacterium]|nr:hypothetical protein [Thermodesulfovibrionales bacterium]